MDTKDKIFNHTPVLLTESIDNLNIKPNGTYIDATLGGGGHSLEIIKKLNTKNGKLLGIDKDTAAHTKATAVLNNYLDAFLPLKCDFCDVNKIKQNIDFANGILIDLGVSSHQLDTASRGFSYNYNSPLDMRMDTSQNFSAYDIINYYTHETLEKILKTYGEERWARRIAQFIVAKRPINTTFELVAAIKNAIPRAVRSDGAHPAKRTFQAIRIEVNNELEVLQRSIEQFIKILYPKGRICIISFHSLEDRIVKHTFKSLEGPCDCPKDLPICCCNKLPEIKIITKKPILPSQTEISQNPRARSAKLRVAEKL